MELATKYLEILGFDKTITSLDDIEKLIKAHISTFSFSSMAVLLEDEISLDLESVYEKIVVNKRGGYCFEHNKLFYEVLKSLGFDVDFYLARVVNNQDIQAPQTHRFTVLNYQKERYLVDVGFGYFCPNKPVKFIDNKSNSGLGYSHTVKQNDGIYFLELVQKKTPYILYTFDLHSCYEVDFELGHFYSHKHPKAVFLNNLVFSLITEDCVYSLRNNGYQKISKDKKENFTIESLEMFQDILKNDFNSSFTDNESKYIYEKYVIN